MFILYLIPLHITVSYKYSKEDDELTDEKRSELRNLLGIENKNDSGDFFQSAEPEVEPEIGIEETGDKEFEMAEPDNESDGSDALISDDEDKTTRKKKKSKSKENVEIEVETEEMKQNREELELLFSSSDEEKHFDLREEEKIKKLEKQKLKKKRFKKKVTIRLNIYQSYNVKFRKWKLKIRLIC